MQRCTPRHENAASAYVEVLREVTAAPALANEGNDAPRLRQPTRETLNLHFRIDSAKDRLISTLNLPIAVARFVWMMSANNRLADIAFYEPRVGSFTDDGLTVPGSSYGMRLRQPQPGLDQVVGAIDRLKENTETRRAAISVYHPIDAIRTSNDIPCAFGMFFHARSGKLNSTILMRSNNALALLPFNIFEFSMLSEVVASECNLELGSIDYFAGSMHVYERDVPRAQGIISGQINKQPIMKQMPRNVSALSELVKLGKIDANIRHASMAINGHSIFDWIENIRDDLSPYWAQIGLLLLCAAAAQKDQATLDNVRRHIDPELRKLIPERAKNENAPTEGTDLNSLFQRTASEKIVVLPRTRLAERFSELASIHELENGPIKAKVLLRAQADIFERLAARGESDVLTMEAFAAAVNAAKE